MSDNFICDLYICCAGRPHYKKLYEKANALFNFLSQKGIKCKCNFTNFSFDKTVLESISKSRLFLFVTDGEIAVDNVGSILKTAPVYSAVNAFYARFFQGANFGCAKVLCLSECLLPPDRFHVIFKNTTHFSESDNFDVIAQWVKCQLAQTTAKVKAERLITEKDAKADEKIDEKIESMVVTKTKKKGQVVGEQDKCIKNAVNKKKQNIENIVNEKKQNVENIVNGQDKKVEQIASDNSSFIIHQSKLVKYVGSEKLVIVPNGITEIGERAFYNNQTVVCVQLPNSVEAIGDHAFSDCKNLADIYLGSELKSIGKAAFSCDESLKMIDFGKTLESIDDNAFWGCNKLFPVLIPLSVKEIGANAFDGIKDFIVRCEHSFQPIGFKDGWEGMGDPFWLAKDANASVSDDSDDWVARVLAMPLKPSKSRGKDGMNYFSDDFHVINGELVYVSREMQNVEIPVGTKSIAPHLFCDRRELRSVTFPSTLIKIGAGAFAKTGLENLIIPPNVKIVEEYAFWGCENLKTVKFSRGVTTLENALFANCTSLLEINIPNTVESIKNAVFWGCESLVQVKIPSSVKEIGERAFVNCLSLENLEFKEGLIRLSENSVAYCPLIKQIKLPISLSSVQKHTFYGMKDCVITISANSSLNFVRSWSGSCKVIKK